MKLTYIIPIFLLVFLCNCTSKQVIDTNDYATYLNSEIDTVELLSVAQFLTDKLNTNPEQYPYLAKRANAYTKVFDTTGDVSYLVKAEADLKSAIEMSGNLTSSYLKALASNYISQHRFKEALELLKEAEQIGDKLNGTKKMLFDVHLELGNYILAEAYLKDIKDTSDFDYLIRLAKWEDHNGNLEGAIIQMEKATKIAEASNLKGIKQWSYTNLADFYGHAGDIKKSYDFYLKALDLNPQDAYAKKGIAWIAYSHENNPDEALRILESVTNYYEAPDYDLLVAEIAEFQNNDDLKQIALDRYQNAVKNENYGDMYNKYNVMIYADDISYPKMALEIAKEEVANRPTPQSYDLLAWSYYRLGSVEKARELVETYVDGKTSEPDVLYHIAEIYKASGKVDAIAPIKKELLTSLYELGPTMKKKIKQL
jgi:tetratricopeptide (TPR) repeat protein